MRCPACGHKNSSLATRCAACGAALVADLASGTAGHGAFGTADTSNAANTPATTPRDPNATMPQNGSPDVAAPADANSLGGTAERPQAADAPTPRADKDPQLREVAGAAGKFVASKWQRVGTFFHTHQRALGVGLAVAVVGIFGAVWLVVNFLDAPAYTTIEANMAERLPSYEYAGGTYGPDLQIPLSSVGVTKRSGTRTPEGMDASNVVGPGAFEVEVEATYDDGKIRVVRDVAATYVRGDDGWLMTGELAEHGTSFTARAGVDESKVLANIGTILNAADSDGSALLSDTYANGSFSVVGNVFKEAANKDTATDDVTIHCSKEGAFFAYEGNVIAHFAFESGSWTLRSAEADAKTTTRNYSPLVGTWSGELVSTQANGASCYGAQGHEFVMTIESVGDPSQGGGQVQGTITAIAHYHQRLEEDQESSEGDVLLERLGFLGTIRASRDEDAGSNLTLSCTTTGSPEGELEFTVSFGIDDDPSAVVARVTSTHTYEETVLFFIPHQTTAEFTDTYLLSRS